MENYFPGAGIINMISEQYQSREPSPASVPPPEPAQFQAPILRDGVQFHPLRQHEEPSPAPAPVPVNPEVVHAEPIQDHENREITHLKQRIKDLERQNRILQDENNILKNKIKLDETIHHVYQSVPSFSQIEKAVYQLKQGLTKE